MRSLDGTEGPDLSYTNNASSPAGVNINLDGISDIWQSVGEGGFLNANKSNSMKLLTGADSGFRFQYLNASRPLGLGAGDGHILNGIAVWKGSENIWNLTGKNATEFGIGNIDAGVNAWAWALFNTSGAWYNVSYDNLTFNISVLNWSSNSVGSWTGEDELGGEFFHDKLSWATKLPHEFNSNGTMSGTLTLVEPSGKSITMDIDQGQIGDVKGGDSGVGLISAGTTEYTYYGTEVDVTSSDVTLSYPEKRRTADLWIGRSTIETSSFAIGDTITGTDYEVAGLGAGGAPEINEITPGIGTIDTSVVFSSLAKPAILVGGASVNQGVYNLAEDGVGVPAANVTMDRAYIQLVENAFGSGETVLVIAGYAAKDTKLACQLLAAKIAGISTISLTGDLVWLDTSGSTYSQVTVI
jgi:hypothetical protein